MENENENIKCISLKDENKTILRLESVDVAQKIIQSSSMSYILINRTLKLKYSENYTLDKDYAKLLSLLNS